MAAPLLVISGCSGVGKSTVSRYLAARLGSSVHVPADDFYLWFEDPWPDAATAEGARRYDAVGAAVGAAAIRLATADYTVILDSPIFPDGVDALSENAESRGVHVHYAVLRAGLSVCLARMRHRDSGGTWDLAEFEAFHARFDDVAGAEAHVIDASGDAESVASAVFSAFRSGRLLRPSESHGSCDGR